MEVEIPCESCKAMLRVPCEAAGHRARCPKCSHEFMVPRLEKLLEDTVSDWIVKDVEECIETRDRSIEEQLRLTVEQERKAREEKERKRAAAHAAADAAAASHGSAAGTHAVDPEHRRRHHHRHEPVNDPDIEIVTEPVRHGRPRKNHAGPGADGQDAYPSAEGHGHNGHHSPTESSHVPSYHTHRAHGDSQELKYPTNLHVEERIPHLVVLGVSAAGVTFAFDSAWLKHDGFRASMPVRCAFSGSTAREKLIARPMVFSDRSVHGSVSHESINQGHENRELGDKHPRQITKMMGTLEGMAKPFCNAMPYYCAHRYAHLHLHTQTRDRSSGGVTCEVLIPDSQTALDWLARVNGVTGPEFERLEADVSLLHGDAWKDLSDEARARIGMWCKLGPREAFRYYFNDADFGKRDEGLAGLVLTDQRVVFCKYHHKGQTSLDTEDASILARTEGKFATLTLRVGHELHRMIKVHRHEVDTLAAALAEKGKIDLRVTQEA